MIPNDIKETEKTVRQAEFSADAEKCMEILKERSVSAGIALSSFQLQQFVKYYDYLVETNRVMNLTALTSPEDVAVKHFIDSLLCYDEGLMKGKRLVDVGTGAGFPGIPLKIYDPSIKIVLLDSLAKRLSFLEALSGHLQLRDVWFNHMRAEDAGRDKNLRGCFDIVTSRAVARLSVLAEYCIPLVKKGGAVVALKGSRYQEEMEEAGKAVRLLGGKMKPVREVTLPGLQDGRAVIIIEKIRETPSAYPRKAGLPAKNPLGS